MSSGDVGQGVNAMDANGEKMFLVVGEQVE